MKLNKRFKTIFDTVNNDFGRINIPIEEEM